MNTKSRLCLKMVAISLILFIFSIPSFAQTATNGNGTAWSTAGNWTNGVPAAGSVATINHPMAISTDIAVTANGSYTFNNVISDANARNLTATGSGNNPIDYGYLIFESGSNGSYFGGDLTINGKGNLIIKNGCTLTINGNATFANNSVVDIQLGGTLIINGSVTNNNNSDLGKELK